MTNCTILEGHVITKLRELPAGSVHCVVTSPPYWGLRSYGTKPQVWGGRADCRHVWKSRRYYTEKSASGSSAEAFSVAGEENAKRLKDSRWRKDDTCTHCGAWRGELGLEPTPELYVEHMLEVFAEVWRVLRDDGTLWLNLGDTYAGGGAGPMGANSEFRKNGRQGGGPKRDLTDAVRPRMYRTAGGLKSKDLVGIPWMVAFALRAAGWYLRSEIIWAKPNPMPESCSDRPSKAHEQIFLLSKSERYFYDEFDARESVTGTANPRGSGVNPKAAKIPNGWDIEKGAHGSIHRQGRTNGTPRVKQNASFSAAISGGLLSDRNWRDVWNITTEAFPEAHYATFPRAIAMRCIVAGASEGGCCAACGAPLERVIEKGKPNREQQRACGGDELGEYHGRATKNFAGARAQDASAVKARILAGMVEKTTVGWVPTCWCGWREDDGARPRRLGVPRRRRRTTRYHWQRWKERIRARWGVPKSCVVMDPFGGSGTVGEVAELYCRDAVLIELLPENINLIRDRTRQPGLALLA